MAVVNGPYIIEKIQYIRDKDRRKEGALLITTTGGEQFGAPMSVNELKARIEQLQRDIESS